MNPLSRPLAWVPSSITECLRRPSRTALAALAAGTVLAAAGLTGCGSSDDADGDASASTSTSPASTPASSAVSTPAATPSASDTPTAEDGVSVDVTFSGDTVSPNGERVDVPVGEDVTLHVTADEAGEIHVHSTPEQELEYDAGTSTVTIGNLDQPGIVEVESHALDKVIVQLQVQ